MRVRTVRVPFRVRAFAAPLAVLALAGLTGCGSDTAPAPSPTAGPGTTASAGQAPAASTPGAAVPATRSAGALPRACDLVPAAPVSTATGLQFAAPAPTEGSRRSVCAFGQAAGGPGLTVGVEPAERFDAKADASRRSAGVPGTAVPGLGEQALFFYSDADLPAGVGGVLVRSGDATIDVTLQGMGDRERTRDAAVAVARVALERL